MKRRSIAAEALAEAQDAAHWYDRQQPGLGAEFVEAVDEALTRLEPTEQHIVVARVRRCAVRSVPVRRFDSYRVIFLDRPDEVRVLAVAHDRQRERYWLGRA